ncbi:hypothetical protein [Tumebacillus flagellatus]|uniref:Uncharacterized protein n=1 Tax=Tumebacillus flagellatus TaxID=1157490 RepID=A0A074LTZ3_9BACL|nr:hypothetical protein [Tumebacillus flagellatus]KEO83318.1 hypothetical protein EL26_10090 [Tumebacillus flagellatus]
MEYKSVSVYLLSGGKLIIIPKGKSEKWGGTLEIEIYHVLEEDCPDNVLEENLLEALEECLNKPNEDLSKSPIEKLLNKRYLQIIKGAKYVALDWSIRKGYSVLPTSNQGKNGFILKKDETLLLGESLQGGDLAKAVRKALELSS